MHYHMLLLILSLYRLIYRLHSRADNSDNKRWHLIAFFYRKVFVLLEACLACDSSC